MISRKLLMKVSICRKTIWNHFNFKNEFSHISGLKNPTSMAKYEKANVLVETLSEAIQIIVVYVSSPGFVLPKAIYSFFMYSNGDLGPDAFELPFPTWWAFTHIYTFYAKCIEIDLILIGNNFKDSIWLEKSRGIFDCSHCAIHNSCIHISILLDHVVACDWKLFICTANTSRFERNDWINEWSI